LSFPCALGRSGRRIGKREGDGATPVGRFALRQGFYRPDRMLRPATRLPLSPLRPSDGWGDGTGDRNYKRPVSHPYPASAEQMWRGDRLYDLVIVLGHNDHPRVRGHGSAVFLHVAPPGLKPTEGCIALEPEHLVRLAKLLSKRSAIVIKA